METNVAISRRHHFRCLKFYVRLNGQELLQEAANALSHGGYGIYAE